MPRQYGADSSPFQALTTPITDSDGITIIDTGNGFGSSPLGIALREQVSFGLPNASFNLLPPIPTDPIAEYDNPLPYWQIQTTPNITATATFDTTTQTWGVKIDPGTAPANDYLTLKTRAWITTDDNLALRQRASLTLAKNGTYAGTSQWNLTLSCEYFDHSNTSIGTTVIGTVYDNTTWASISGTTTTGGSAIPSSASWAEFTVKLTATGTVSSSTSATLKSLLVATSTPATGSFVVADSFTASGTWVRPTGVNYVTVVAVGGGGGGKAGAVAANYVIDFNAGGGGGGGSSSWAIIRDLYVGGDTNISVGIGTAGAGGAGTVISKAAGVTTTYNTTPANGGAGGATTFGTYLTIPGGSGAATGGGGAGAAPTSSMYGIAYLGAVAGTAGTPNAAAGSASAYAQLPGWSATFAAGAAGATATTTSSAGGTLFTGTGAVAGSAGIIGGGAGGGGATISTAPLTPSIAAPGIGGYGAGSGGGASLARITATSTVVVTGGSGGAGAANSGAGGGGGAGALVSASGSAVYNASTITFTAGSGGNGSAGRLYVIYTA